jgi:hypothetical protein
MGAMMMMMMIVDVLEDFARFSPAVITHITHTSHLFSAIRERQ